MADDDEELKKSSYAVFSDRGRFLKGPTLVRERQEIASEAKELGIGLGELIHAMTDAVGIKQCSPCKSRQKSLDVFRIPKKMIPWASLLQKVDELRDEPDEIKVTWIK